MEYNPTPEHPYGTQMTDFAESIGMGGPGVSSNTSGNKNNIDELEERMASAEGILNSLVVQMEGAHEAIKLIAELIEGKIPEEEKRQRKTNDGNN